MASRLLRKIMGISQGMVIVPGAFAPNSSSAVDATLNTGSGWTVAYTSTGLFTVTFADTYPKLISCVATLQLSTGDDKYVQIGDYSASAGTLKIRVWDASGAAVADVSANANNRINFIAVFGNMSFT